MVVQINQMYIMNAQNFVSNDGEMELNDQKTVI